MQDEPYGYGVTTGGLADTTDGGGGSGTDTSTGPLTAAVSSDSSSSATTGDTATSAASSSETATASSTSSSTTGTAISSAITAVTVNSNAVTVSSVTVSSSTVATATTGDTSTTGDTTATSTTGGVDNCPNDANKTEPGVCGCGTPDTDINCAALASALVHRYSFDGTGAAVSDSVGTANGNALGATQSGGSVSMTGTQYVDLPNGIISSLTSVTIETWVTWSGGGAWQRVFDFGVSDGGENARGIGDSYFFLTPQAIDASGLLRAAVTTSGPAGEAYIEGAAALAAGVSTHVAVSIGGGMLSLFINGSSLGSVAFSGLLSGITDTNNWLGYSQFDADPGFVGSIQEFRIYDAALTATQVSASYSLGPDVPLQ